jgi:hypothetical protein|tara:strand:- start:225 stop:425 length:201 start_codon:yes stop_codon:yes gene_type:complete
MDLRNAFDELNLHVRNLVAYAYYHHKDDAQLTHYCKEVINVLDDIYTHFWTEDLQYINDNDEEIPH